MKLFEKGEKQKVKTIGRKRIFLIVLWSLFIFAFGWSIYKNFTAVDTRTVHETKVVEQNIYDTHAVESFFSGFVDVFYNFEKDAKSLSERKGNLASYMTEDLISINSDVIKAEDEIRSKLIDYNVWKIEQQKDKHYFTVTYSVRQGISRIKIEMKKETVKEKVAGKIVEKEVEKPSKKDVYETVDSAYYVVLYVDDSGNIVIVQNPTITSIPVKSDYEKSKLLSDGSVDSKTSEEITEFLQNFFELYPTIDSSALSYYVDNDVMPVIGKDYKFVELTEKVYNKVDGSIKAYVTVKYYDDKTGLNQLSQYCLGVEKKDKWIIVSNDLRL